MKRISALIFLTLCFAVFGQDKLPEFPRNEKGEITYQEVVQVEGVSAAELRSRARAWIANTFRSAKDVVQLDDAEAGRIIVKGLLGATWNISKRLARTDYFRHTLTIEIKDGRYRYTLDSFALTSKQEDTDTPIEEDLRIHGQKHPEIAAKLYSALVVSIDSEIASPTGH